MSSIIINGTLIQNGNVTCDGDITVTPSGLVIPIGSDYYTRQIYSCQAKKYVTCTGKSRYIRSLTGNVIINGTIDGEGQGFPASRGPGCNSVLLDNQHHPIFGYGATHAGLGAMNPDPGTTGYYDEEITITGEEVDQKWFLLTASPINGDIAVNPTHGPSQYYPDDFDLDWNLLSWRRKPMEPIVILGEVFRVLYNGTTEQVVPSPTRPYGSYEAPLSFGSGSHFTQGGGGIWIEAQSGTVSVNGLIDMNGESGLPGQNTGGAAGGSVWINAWAIDGIGTILAEGGSTAWPYAGGGGGGYLSMTYERSYSYTGSFSVIGVDGGSEGKVHIHKIAPFFQEKFTGKIWNEKWWEIVSAGSDTTLNNFVLFNTPQGDPKSPAVQSLFSLSGDIKADIDYMPFGSEAGFYSNSMLLYKDFQNWVGIAKKNEYLFGVYSVGGNMSQTGMAIDNTNLTFRLLKQDSTFTFQYYDSTSTPQTLYSETIPELRTSKFKVRLGVDKLQWPDATSVIVEHLAPTSVDLVRNCITLSTDPLDTSNVALNIVGGTSQYQDIDYYVSGRQIKWDSSTLDTMLPDGTVLTEYFHISSTDIANKYINLSMYPYTEADVAVNVCAGPPQNLGTDFYIYRNQLFWGNKGMENVLIADDTIAVTYFGEPTYIPERLVYALTRKDVLRIVYRADTSNNSVSAGFDTFRLFRGTLYDAESTEPVLYVDPVHGSDFNDGRNLNPLQNLFVATAWSKRGGTVVLYDGTHNPTELVGKDVTIMGAYGALPVVTTTNVLDSTGSNWEIASLTFDECQGRVQNLHLSGAVKGLFAHATDNIEVVDCEVSDATTGLSFRTVPTMGVVVRGTKIHGVAIGMDFSGCYDPYVNSCVIYDSTIGIYASDTTNIIITSSTLDSDSTAIWLDGTCSGIIASNNLTNCDSDVSGCGIYLSEDSMPVSVIDNNFSGTSNPFGGRYPDVELNNCSIDPAYVSQAGRDYRLRSDSTNRDNGIEDYDRFMRDFQGLSRATLAPPDRGAFEYVDGTHTGSYYVSGAVWEDSSNFGGAGDPFRTLDKAMLHDGQTYVAAGHLDSYHLGLSNSRVLIDGKTTTWLDGTTLYAHDGSSATFRTHFGNLDISKAVYASPNGNDLIGTGSFINPYRTINAALVDSSDGDFIVVMSGEYPEFTGVRGRTILFQPDRTSIQVDGTRRFMCDLFDQPDLRQFGHVEYDPQWTLDYTGASSATISDGFLRLTHDATNTVRADSTFTFTRDFDISADIRNVSEPVMFSVHNADTTATLTYDDGSYRVDIGADGRSTYCYGELSIGPVEDKEFWTDYLCLTTDDTRVGWAPLSLMTTDCSSSAVNLIGGIAQEYGVDYKLEGGRLVWRGLELDGVLDPGDNMRVIYKAKDISEKARAMISLHGSRLAVKVSDGRTWLTLARRDVSTNLDGQWGASFYMDQTGLAESPCQVGRAFISNFQVIASTITGTDLDQPFLQKTERKTVIISRMYPTILASALADGTTVAGSISPSGNIPVLFGSSQSFAIAPNFGYQINNVLIDGSSVGAMTSYTFTNVITGHDILATFDRT